MRDLKIPEQRHPEKARRPDNPQPKKPSWIRVKAPVGEGYKATHKIMREHKLTTVCEEAGCPNVGECWSQGHATMMIMGEICTRGCTFCNVATGRPEGYGDPLPYLANPKGGFDIELDVHLLTQTARQSGLGPQRLSRTTFARQFWSPAQMVVHHTSNGCNLNVGDLFGSGTVSGPGSDEAGAMIELTKAGREPIKLHSGEERGFLQDGDTVILRGRCKRPGFASIGFGECSALVLGAPEGS